MPLVIAPDDFIKLSPRAPIARVDIEDVLFKGRTALRRKAEGVELFQRARLNADAVHEQSVLFFGEHFAHHLGYAQRRLLPDFEIGIGICIGMTL